MIDLYAIISDGEPMEVFVRAAKSRAQMEAIMKHACKAIRASESRIVKIISVGAYRVYYFRQDSFIFMLATQVSTRAKRMQNYLRVVADIFYENYDERKFKYVLDKIMEEANRIEDGARKDNTQLEDEESSLVERTILQEKMKLNSLVQSKQRESIRAYIVITLLFLSIVALAVLYLGRRWG